MSEPGLIWTRKRTSIKSFGPSFNIYFKGPVDAGELKNWSWAQYSHRLIFVQPSIESRHRRPFFVLRRRRQTLGEKMIFRKGVSSRLLSLRGCNCSLTITRPDRQTRSRLNQESTSQPTSRLQWRKPGPVEAADIDASRIGWCELRCQPELASRLTSAPTFKGRRADLVVIRKSSSCRPALSKATSHRGCLPRPDHVSEELSGFRYFGTTAG